MFKVLSHNEERELGKDEIRNYYANLKEFVLKRKLTNTTIGALTVAPKLKGITNKIATKVTRFLCKIDVEIIVDGIENIPEGTWNLSPNKLHLPIRFGFLDIARKAAAAVVPMVMEYTYDSTQAVECIKKIHIRFGKAMYVDVYDDLKQKLTEYEEVISTMRLELMEEKGVFSRKAISNQEYINFLKGNFHNLQLGGIDLDSERSHILGADDNFYVFHHINDVPFNDQGMLLQ